MRKAIGWIKSVKLNNSFKIEFRDKTKYNGDEIIYTIEGNSFKKDENIENCEFKFNEALKVELVYQLYKNKELLVFEINDNKVPYELKSIETYDE